MDFQRKTKKTKGGFRPFTVALSTAILLTLAMPGSPGWWPLLFVALTPLLRNILYASPGKSFKTGLLTGLLYYPVLIYWIVIVLNRYGGLPIWMAAGALFLLSLYMSLYLGTFCAVISWLAGRYWQKERPLGAMILLAPFFWVGLDWLRGESSVGFPWMDLAYGLYEQPRLIQAADLGGHHLITFCIVLINCLILYVIEQQKTLVRWNARAERRFMLFLCCFLVFVGGYSYLRYDVVSRFCSRALSAQVTVIQGNIDQNDKWTEENKEKTVEKYLVLSNRALEDSVSELVVWPETAMPFFPHSSHLFGKIERFVQTGNTWLLTGAPFFTRFDDEGQGAVTKYFNSAVLVNPDGILLQRYDKMHLVPFGEYVPLREVFPFLAPLVEAITDFSPGESLTTLSFGKLNLGVLICFESIFPELARNQTRLGANVLVNITNDAWYGKSSAPHQTLAMAVLRSVENRRSLIRSANTGISCFIDPLGRVVDKTELFVDAALSGSIPLMEVSSLYTRFGDSFGPACFSLFFAILLFFRHKQ